VWYNTLFGCGWWYKWRKVFLVNLCITFQVRKYGLCAVNFSMPTLFACKAPNLPGHCFHVIAWALISCMCGSTAVSAFCRGRAVSFNMIHFITCEAFPKLVGLVGTHIWYMSFFFAMETSYVRAVIFNMSNLFTKNSLCKWKIWFQKILPWTC